MRWEGPPRPNKSGGWPHTLLIYMIVACNAPAVQMLCASLVPLLHVLCTFHVPTLCLLCSCCRTAETHRTRRVGAWQVQGDCA